MVFHAWIDAADSSAHLILQNTTERPVAVGFQAELRGASGTVSTATHCAWLRPGEFALAPRFAYPSAALTSVRIGAAQVFPLDPSAFPTARAGSLPRDLPRHPPSPAPLPTGSAPKPTPPRRAGSAPLPGAARPDPVDAIARDSVASRRRRDSVDTARIPGHDSSRAVPVRADGVRRSSASRRDAAAHQGTARSALGISMRQDSPRMNVRVTWAATILSAAAGALLVTSGVVLGIAVAAALFLLGWLVPRDVLRRARVARKRHK